MSREGWSRAVRACFAAALLASAGPLLIVGLWRPSEPRPPDGGLAWTVPGEIVVAVREPGRPGAAAAIGARAGFAMAPSGPPEAPSAILVTRVPAASVGAVVARLRADPSVEAAEPQRLYRVPAGEVAVRAAEAPAPKPTAGAVWRPNDPRYPQQWNFDRIHAERAWPVTRGRGVVVAVIDTGVALGYAGTAAPCRDFRSTGFTAPYDFVHRTAAPMDDNGHGTHVAGTIAESTDNGEGAAGIAFECRLMPLKVLTADGSGRASDIAAAIRYAADRGANVINMSLGGPLPDGVTRAAVLYARSKGVTIVCAAGNGGGEGVSYPARYPECIAVSALGPNGDLAPYSSWGPSVAISAPGGDKAGGEQFGILQNTLVRAEPGSEPVDDYYWFQGTSMAAPHVAATAALVASLGVSDPEEVRGILQASAAPREPRAQYGAGELDAGAAVVRAGAAAGAERENRAVLAALWLGALLVGAARRGPRKALWVGALAVTLGATVPDAIAAWAGFGSAWNLLGHGAVIPAYLLAYEADAPGERRFYALLAVGAAARLGWDLRAGYAPLPGAEGWAALPWIWTNLAVAGAVALSGLRVTRPRGMV